MFTISASDFGTVAMHRRMRACADEFLATVTAGVVHSVYIFVSRSSVDVTRQHKASMEVNGLSLCHKVASNLGR